MNRIPQSKLTWVIVSSSMLVLVVASGCASGPPKSGFLSDYSTLEEAPAEAPIWNWVDPERRRREVKVRIWRQPPDLQTLAKYDRILVDEAVVQFRPGARGAWVSPERLHEFTRKMRATLLETMTDRYPLADGPGEGVLRFRRALTDAYPKRAYSVPDPDNHPVKSWMDSTPGGAVFEAQAIDSVTGERVFAIVAAVRGSYYDTASDQDIWKYPRRSFTGLARFIRKLMDDAHGHDTPAP